MTDLPLGVEAYPEEAVGRSDAELITAVRSGDTEAYGELFDRHVGSARSMARQLTRDPNEAEDLVAEAFAKVLVVLQGGGGPDVAFRAYLLTALRRVAYDRTRSGSRVQVTDDLTPFDTGVDFVDPAIEGLEKSIVARAYASLPERWQTVLWHTEVEGLQPGEVAPLLGLTANGVAALAYRAREGLRQAYLQQHVMGELDDACRPYADKLGAYARGGLAKRETAHVEQHLEGCERCRALVLELSDVNHGMRVVVAPLLLGLAAAGYLKAAAAGGAAVGAVGSGAGGAAAGAGTASAVGAAGATGAAGTAATAAGAGATATAGAGMTAAVTGAAAAAGSASTGALAAGAASGGSGASVSVGYVTSTASSTAGATSTAAAGTTAGLTVVPSAAAAGGLFAGGGLLVGAAAAVVGLAAAGVVVAVVASTNDQGPVTALPPTTSTSVPALPRESSSEPPSSSAPVLPAPAATSSAPAPAASRAASTTPTSLPALVATPTHSVPNPTPTTALTTTPTATPTTAPTPKPEPTTTTEPAPVPTPIPTFDPMPPPPPSAPPTPPTVPPTGTPAPTDTTVPNPTPTDTTPPPNPTPTDTTPPPTPTSSPDPTPTSSPSGPLVVTFPPEPFGQLVAGQTGTAGFALQNTGSSAIASLTATITLPTGITLVTGEQGIDTGKSGWSCLSVDSGAVCTYPALPPGASTTLALQVQVAAEVAAGTGGIGIAIEGKQIDPVTVQDTRPVESASNGTTSSSG